MNPLAIILALSLILALELLILWLLELRAANRGPQ